MEKPELVRQRTEHQADVGVDEDNPDRDYPVHPVTGKRITVAEHEAFSAMNKGELEQLRAELAPKAAALESVAPAAPANPPSTTPPST